MIHYHDVDVDAERLQKKMKVLYAIVKHLMTLNKRKPFCNTSVNRTSYTNKRAVMIPTSSLLKKQLALSH